MLWRDITGGAAVAAVAVAVVACARGTVTGSRCGHRVNGGPVGTARPIAPSPRQRSRCGRGARRGATAARRARLGTVTGRSHRSHVVHGGLGAPGGAVAPTPTTVTVRSRRARLRRGAHGWVRTRRARRRRGPDGGHGSITARAAPRPGGRGPGLLRTRSISFQVESPSRIRVSVAGILPRPCH